MPTKAQSARAVVEQLTATINAHDPAAGAVLFASDARLVSAGGRMFSLAGLGQLLADSLVAFPDLQVKVTRWVEDGDLVVTEEVMEGTHRGDFAGLSPTGRRVRLAMAHVTRVKDGRIVERIAYHDTAGILRQLRT
ncbi:MAG: ester cyclase [Acidimicrobiales bacterium]